LRAALSRTCLWEKAADPFLPKVIDDLVKGTRVVTIVDQHVSFPAHRRGCFFVLASLQRWFVDEHHNAGSAFFIISKDADYDVLIKTLKTIGVDVQRRTCIADVTKAEPEAPSIHDLAATAIATLRRIPHRPSTAKTLRNVLNVKKEFSEEQLLEVIGALTKSGVVQMVGNKASYHLPEKA
jgi:hypothetical protein